MHLNNMYTESSTITVVLSAFGSSQEHQKISFQIARNALLLSACVFADYKIMYGLRYIHVMFCKG